MDIIFDCSTFAMYDSYIKDIYVNVHLARLNLFYTYFNLYIIVALPLAATAASVDGNYNNWKI